MKRLRAPIIMDIEASGFGCESYPIEVGVVNRDGDRYCALIKPQKDWSHWCKNAEAVHGIAREVIELRGKDPREICRELNEFLGHETAYSDAWTYDKTWLNRLYFAAGMECSFYLSPIENIASDEQFLLWDKVKARLQSELNIQRHRASGDAYLIQQTYIETSGQLLKVGGCAMG